MEVIFLFISNFVFEKEKFKCYIFRVARLLTNSWYLVRGHSTFWATGSGNVILKTIAPIITRLFSFYTLFTVLKDFCFFP